MANRKRSIGCVLILGGTLTNCGGTVETRSDGGNEQGGAPGSGFVGVPANGGFTGNVGTIGAGTGPYGGSTGIGFGGYVGTCCPGAGGGGYVPGAGAGGYVGVGGAPGTEGGYGNEGGVGTAEGGYGNEGGVRTEGGEAAVGGDTAAG